MGIDDMEAKITFLVNFQKNFFPFYSSTGLTFCNVEHEAVIIFR